MWQTHPIWEIIVVGYLIALGIYSLLRLMFTSRKTFSIVLAALFFSTAILLTYIFIVPKDQESVRLTLLILMVGVVPVLTGVIIAPDIRAKFEAGWSQEVVKPLGIRASSEQTKEHIIDAVTELSNRKIGALITMENHNTLDQYAEKAIMINGRVTKELILNIFTPLTPLHDGAVIVRGDEILCAGAYFTLSTNELSDKTIGSRHRAALGISENSDSLTIVVSEETGDISIAVSSMLIKLSNREKLFEYLNLYIK